MTALGIDIDLREDYLEEALEDDLECEADHEVVGVACTFSVTHLYKTCFVPKLVCSAAAQYAYQAVASRAKCHDCGRHCRDCWSVVPV